MAPQTPLDGPRTHFVAGRVVPALVFMVSFPIRVLFQGIITKKQDIISEQMDTVLRQNPIVLKQAAKIKPRGLPGAEV